jgi:hypothetical protein
MPHREFFATSNPWNSNRPHVLVMACSDGRLQEPLDEFLNTALGISYYDRVLLPGGPGALAPSGTEFMRTARMTEEVRFLIDAHQIEEIVLVYHSPAVGGPDLAICADYRRLYPTFDAERIRKQQEEDTDLILKGPLSSFPSEHVHAYRLEVTPELGIHVKKLA